MAREYTDEEIKKILQENKVLKRDNSYLLKLTNSKRFKFAEKVANGFNVLFPKDTPQRKIVEVVGNIYRKKQKGKQHRAILKISKKIYEMAKTYDKIIVLNSVLWDLRLKQRPHHLAQKLSELGFFVIYLEYDNPVHNMRKISDNLITINSEDYLGALSDMPNKYFLSPNNMPTKYETLRKIVDNYKFKFIYDYLDEFHEDISGDLSVQMKVWDNLKSLKPVLCTATATRLYDELKEHLGKEYKIIMVRNAVNVEHFDYKKNNSVVPIDLKSVVKQKKPIVGFYGALAPWIDFDLINWVAEKNLEWNFVLLGIDYNGAAIELKKNKNVYNLGAKDYNDLPKYAKYFDCAIIPFKQGEIAKATSPVKLFEYMAAGLPTVCTRDLKECVGYEYVYMAKNKKEFEEMIKKAIKEHGRDEVKEALLFQAKQNTWAERANNIAKALAE